MEAGGSQALLAAYFEMNGLLLCNESAELPYLDMVGGDWNGIVALMERGDVFYSKLYKGRVTYLSRAFYAQIKPYRQRLAHVSPAAAEVFAFLRDAGKANAAEIKSVLMLSGKVYSQSMDELFRELLVTVMERDRTINESWSSFRWGTFDAWERLHPVGDIAASYGEAWHLVQNVLTEKQFLHLMQ